MARRVEQAHNVDTSETGPPRLHAPERRQVVEFGPARLKPLFLVTYPLRSSPEL